MREKMALGCGRVRLVLRNADGSVAETRDVHNFITYAGEAHVADRLSVTPDEAAMSHIAIGTGTGRTVTSTSLVTEVARVALDSGHPQQQAGADDNDIKYKATFGTSVPASQQTIKEIAVFNASSGGTMLNYSDTFTPVVKETTQTLTVEVTVTLGVS